MLGGLVDFFKQIVECRQRGIHGIFELLVFSFVLPNHIGGEVAVRKLFEHGEILFKRHFNRFHHAVHALNNLLVSTLEFLGILPSAEIAL